MAFKSSFFSWAGQKERFKNVLDVLKISTGLKKGKITAKAGILSKPLEAIAEHPFIEAGALTGLTGIGRTAIKLTAAKAGTAFKAAKFGTQAKIVGAGLIAAPLLIKSKKARKAAGEIPSIPKKAVSFGAGVADVIEGRKGIADLIKENPLISAGVGILGLGAVLPAAVPAAGALIASKQRKDIAQAIGALPAAAAGIPKGAPQVAAEIISPTAVVKPKKSIKAPKHKASPLVINQIQISN